MPSDWMQATITRRDARHTHDDLSDDATPIHHTERAKKNRRRWCRGKVGVEHVLLTKLIDERHPGWGTVEYCRNCGKHLHFHWRPWNERPRS